MRAVRLLENVHLVLGELHVERSDGSPKLMQPYAMRLTFSPLRPSRV